MQSTNSRKELKEQLQHGTSIFPLASYRWQKEHLDNRVALHWHPEVELVHFIEGRFTYALNAGQPLVVEAPAILIVPGNTLHTLYLPKLCSLESIVFDLTMLSLEHYDELESDIFEAFLSGNMPSPKIITKDDRSFAHLCDLIHEIVISADAENAADRLLIKARLLELIALAYRGGFLVRREDKSFVQERTKQDRLKDLLTYIDAHYAGPMMVADAAGRLQVSVQYFCRYFKKVTGMSFTEYLNDLRLRRAAAAIAESSKPIAAVAAEHGFDNTGYFFKSFKEKYGTTPLKYRKEHQKPLIFS